MSLTRHQRMKLAFLSASPAAGTAVQDIIYCFFLVGFHFVCHFAAPSCNFFSASILRGIFFHRCRCHPFYMFFLQSQIHNFPENSITNRCKRNKDEHPRNSHKISADGNCSKNPDGRKSDGTSDHMRIDQIPFNLLKQQKYKDKQHCLFRTYHKNQKTAHCASDKRAKDWDQCSKGDQGSDQQCIGHFQNA